MLASVVMHRQTVLRLQSVTDAARSHQKWSGSRNGRGRREACGLIHGLVRPGLLLRRPFPNAQVPRKTRCPSHGGRVVVLAYQRCHCDSLILRHGNLGGASGDAMKGDGVKKHENAWQQVNAGGVQFVEAFGLVITLWAVTSPSMKLLVAQSAIFECLWCAQTSCAMFASWCPAQSFFVRRSTHACVEATATLYCCRP